MQYHDYSSRCSLLYRTTHYDFHYRPGSRAERDILEIANTQEHCYRVITSALNIFPDFRIHYFLLDTPEEVGEVYGDNDPCNGFASYPDLIFAVYNDSVKCIGMHEDTHLISYARGLSPYALLREGLAMYMDKTWWDIPNAQWVRDFLENGTYIPVEQLFENDAFFAISDTISYPIAGAFTDFLIQNMGMPEYQKSIYYSDRNLLISLETAFHKPLPQICQDFLSWVTSEHEKTPV